MSQPIVHILNGDCLALQLASTQIAGEVIICREALIEGPVAADTFQEFLALRSQFISEIYRVTQAEYVQKTEAEFQKIINIRAGSSVYLWFEDDLFCQANLWFILHLLRAHPHLRIFRVFPPRRDADNWKGFSEATSIELTQMYEEAIPITPSDLTLGQALWRAFQLQNLEEMEVLAATPTQAFRWLREVVKAHAARFPLGSGQPDRFLKELMNSGVTDFSGICQRFSQAHGIYGFGDSQIKCLISQLK